MDKRSARTVRADERSARTARADEWSARAARADERSARTARADQRSAQTARADERSARTVRADERSDPSISTQAFRLTELYEKCNFFGTANCKSRVDKICAVPGVYVLLIKTERRKRRVDRVHRKGLFRRVPLGMRAPLKHFQAPLETLANMGAVLTSGWASWAKSATV